MDEVKFKYLSNELELILIASDISENSFEKVMKFADKEFFERNLIKLNYTKDDLESVIGKYAAVIGVTDANIGNKIRLLTEQKAERNDAYNDKI